MLSFVINMSAIGFSLFVDDVNSSLLGLLLVYTINMSENMLETTESYAGL